MRVALTGAAGYLGTHLATALDAAGHEVFGTDRHPFTRPGPTLMYLALGTAPISDREVFDLADANAIRNWLTAVDPDVVVHMAARTGRLFGEDDRRDAVRSNAEATVNVAQACGERGTRLVYASSSEIYGDTGELCTEDGPFALPHNLYGLSKRWGEEACRLYAPDGLTVWRISMPYGPGSKIGSRGYNALHMFLHSAHHRMPITLHRGASRSWTYVSDTMAAMLATLDRPGVWNIGGDGDHRPMREVAELACKIAGAGRGLIREHPAPPAQTLVKRISSAKLETETGWCAKVPLEDGMRETYAWVRRHGWDGVLAG